jgi:hypothetical protein
MERLAMSQTREILRLRWAVRLSVRETARATKQSTGVVSKTANRAKLAGLTWAEVEGLEECELERRLYGGPKHSSDGRAEPDPAFIDQDGSDLREARVRDLEKRGVIAGFWRPTSAQAYASK